MSKRILISGGSRGIGRACVELFASRGHKVAFIYRSDDEAAMECAKNTGAISIKADVSIHSDAKRAVNEAILALGGIDVLVNNAGISMTKLFSDTTYEDWRAVIDTNLSSAFTLSRECSKIMISNHSGSIVNIGSVWGRCGASCEVVYSASKAGLRGLTMALAKELGPSGITVNAIAPGVINTDMNKSLSKEDIDCLVDETPLMRIGESSDVANVALFLAGDGASFVTGEVINVSGGYVI